MAEQGVAEGRLGDAPITPARLAARASRTWIRRGVPAVDSSSAGRPALAPQDGCGDGTAVTVIVQGHLVLTWTLTSPKFVPSAAIFL
jgi:hypothetical protein